MAITNHTLRTWCPTSGEEVIASIDDIGRMTVAPARGSTPEERGEKAQDTDAWIKTLHGRKGYVAVYNDRSARGELGKAGALRIQAVEPGEAVSHAN